ncbi:MAG: CapA family protein [Alphaproteobacteria bacterium]|nr:CapA family protein [Alphaproteobacteria bacterium]
MPGRVTLAFLGDLMLGRGVSRELRRRPPEWFWGDTLPMLRRADAVLANLESPITAHRGRWRLGWKFFHFRADPEALGILAAGGIRFACLANNHMLDYGDRGLLDTIDALDGAGIAHAGAGRSAVEASAPVMLDVGGLKVGLVAATDNMREFAAAPHGPGTNHRIFRPDSHDLDWIERSASDLRRAGAALIVLSVHWGPNMRTSPSRDLRGFAHAAVDRGIDVIHGHSAHVTQAIERRGRGVILYDTGDFIDDYWKFPFRHTNWSFAFNLVVEDGRPARLQLVPVVIHPWPPTVATGDQFRAITANMRSLCAAAGTATVETAEGLEVALGGT